VVIFALPAALVVLVLSATSASGELTEQAEMVGPGANSSNFGGGGEGVSLSGDGDTALIGESEKGEAFVYTRSGASWSKQAALTPPGWNQGFGTSVALSADGDTAIATQFGEGTWVYTRSGSTWTRQTEEPLTAGPVEGENGGMWQFGNSVAISSDGSTAVIGAVSQSKEGNSACAWIFKRTGSRWARVAMLKGADETIFGHGSYAWPGVASISGDGRTVVLSNGPGAQGKGGAWIFEESGGRWIERTRLSPSGESGPGGFGTSVSLSRDGSTVLIGASSDAYGGGGAWAFTRGEDGWQQQGEELFPPLEPLTGGFGESVALSADGTSALIGAPNSDFPDNFPGAVWVYRRTGERWWPEQKILDPVIHREASTGKSVALSDEATTALLASPGQATGGAVWAFTGPTTPGAEIPPAPPAVPATGQWASLGGNPARTATVTSLHPPFATAWSKTFQGPAGTHAWKEEESGKQVEIPAEEFAGYPLLGNGLVYVVHANTGSPQKSEIDALSQQTGALVWSRELASGASTVFTALDGNRLFAISGYPEGLTALDALTGQELWHREVNNEEPLVASEGVLYYVGASIGAETIAVDETTGRTIWEGQMFNSTGAGPLLGDGRVYTMGSAPQGSGEKGVSGWAWDEKTGELLWEDAPEASGDRGSSWTAELAEGRLWTADTGNLTEYSGEWSRGAIVDPATGTQLGNYDAMNSNSPIIDGEDVIGLAERWACQPWPACSLQAATLTSKDATGKTLWTFEGDGRLDSGIVRTGEDLLVGSASGNLYAVNQSTGRQVWKATMPAGFRPENLNGIGTPTGMAANVNVLAVVTDGTLTLMTGNGKPEEPGSAETPVPGEPTITPPQTGTSTSTGVSSAVAGAGSQGSDTHPGGGVAGTRTGVTPLCTLSGRVNARHLPNGALRLRVSLHCSAAATVTLRAGYRGHHGPHSDAVLVTLTHRTMRLARGTTTVTLNLPPGTARSIRQHDHIDIGLSIHP
jgi:outer membrane protein assembly factor BamB